MKKKLLPPLLIIFLNPAAAETTLYVTDQLKIEVRSGQSTQHKILRFLPSGTPVTVLEQTDDGYTRVITPQGTDGWMLSRHLMDTPSARDRLAQLESNYNQLESESANLKQELNDLVALKSDLEERNRNFQDQDAELQQELEKLRRTAARPVELAKQNKQLQQQLKDERSTIGELRNENELLKAQTKRKWFLTGAGVTLGALLVGLVIPRIPWRRRRSWGEF